MNLRIRNFIFLALMLVTSGLAIALRPTHKIADQRPLFNLETTIPHAFGEWREEPQFSTRIVDPQQKELIDLVYKQTLSRTYVNAAGYRIMLSLAYVESQSGLFGAHLPEICYPSQGFQVGEQFAGQIKTSGTSIPVQRLLATKGGRVEPITYWVTVGDQVTIASIQRKLAKMRFALHGEIPDGMLVRVSSIDIDKAGAYKVHARFINDFEAALPNDLHALLFGQISKS